METPHEILDPLPYHVELRDCLKARERALWDWFASARAQENYTENLRLDLLKSAYRLDVESHPELYQAVEAAKAGLGLDIPVTVYQAQNNPHVNATLYFMPGEGHVVFSGATLTLLNADELKSSLGHELAHYHLWTRDEGEFLIADRLITAAAADPRAAASHQQSARRFQLYTEIFADRGSLRVTNEVAPVVAGLVKMETGLAQVSAASYLKQAEEIFARRAVSTEGLSHPETFIRARALSLWRENPAEAPAQISKMIEGPVALDDLDLIGQTRLARQTRQLLAHFLAPKWFQTPVVLGHARLFFSDFQPALADDSTLAAIDASDPKFRDYLCFLLLDFVTADHELDDLPLAAALAFSDKLGLDEFEKLAARELKMKARDIRKIKEHAAETLANAEARHE